MAIMEVCLHNNSMQLTCEVLHNVSLELFLGVGQVLLLPLETSEITAVQFDAQGLTKQNELALSEFGNNSKTLTPLAMSFLRSLR
jgi:hypothetical protein